MRLPNLLHECIYSLLKRPAVQRASKVITSHILLACTFLVVLWKRVAVTFVEVSLVLGFCCWPTPITLTVLCVSTCSDGLLDFHRSTLDFYINVELHEHFQPMVIPTPASFSSSPRGCCKRIRPTVGGSPKPPWPPSSPATPASRERWPLMTTPSVRGTGYTHPPLHSLGDCYVVGVCYLFVSRMLLSRKHFFSEFATFSLVFADRRATARTTTFVEPCSIQIKKKPLMTTPWDPSSVPSLRMVDGSRVTLLVCSLSLLSSSTSESDGPLSSPQRVLVAGSFARPSSPCAPLPVSPLPCLSSDTVWLVLWLVTVLQGPCQ